MLMHLSLLTPSIVQSAINISLYRRTGSSINEHLSTNFRTFAARVFVLNFFSPTNSEVSSLPEASISTRILGPDPTTFEAYSLGSIPLVDPTKFWEDVGDAHTAMETKTKNRHHQRRFPNLKYMQMRWRPGLRRRPRWGAYSDPPDPLLDFVGGAKKVD